MNTIEVNRSNGTRTQQVAREPSPAYDANEEEATSSPLPDHREPAGPEPTPVTAREAGRRRLWDGGILVLFGEGQSYVVGPIDEDLTTDSIHSNPNRESQEFNLRPDQELVFVPSASEEPTAESPPVRVHRRRTVVRLQPDTASRYGALYRLLSAVGCVPVAVGEDLDRLTWAMVYGSIAVAKRAERILREARGLVAE